MDRAKLVAFLSAILAITILALPAFADIQAAKNKKGVLNIYEAVSALTGVPSDLLWATANVETKNNAFYCNYKNKSYEFKTKKEAVRFLNNVGDNVDIGLAQINCMWWCRRLNVTKYDLLDPKVNLTASAKIHQINFREHYYSKSNPTPRDFWKAVGHYHSTKRFRSVNYAWLVHDALKRLNRARLYKKGRERGGK